MTKLTLTRRSSEVARVLLRLPAALHETLKGIASDERLSFNEFCVRRLRAAAASSEVPALQKEVIERADELFGSGVLGLIALGSWVRGDATADSDVDVLVVLDSTVPLTRDLYRRWDAGGPISVSGRALDEHFVSIPAAGATPTALWCEAAVEGLVWLDRSGAIVRHLANVRRAIADGRVRRSSVHGQPYWKGVA